MCSTQQNKININRKIKIRFVNKEWTLISTRYTMVLYDLFIMSYYMSFIQILINKKYTLLTVVSISDTFMNRLQSLWCNVRLDWNNTKRDKINEGLTIMCVTILWIRAVCPMLENFKQVSSLKTELYRHVTQLFDRRICFNIRI